MVTYFLVSFSYPVSHRRPKMNFGTIEAVPFATIKTAVSQLQRPPLAAATGDHVLLHHLDPLSLQARFLLRRESTLDIFTH